MKNLFLLFSLCSLLTTQYSFSQNYWQQRVDYTITVKLDDERHELSGFETMEYNNHSETPLSFIYFHLWPNAYKDNTSALAKQFLQQGKRNLYFAEYKDRGFIDSLDFKTDGVSLKLEIDKDNPDICKVYLTKDLLPGEKVTVSTPFHVKIPSCKFSRLGHDNQADRKSVV